MASSPNDIPSILTLFDQVWRDVKAFGAKGDGVTDDTAAINLAITAGNRCGQDCGSTTTLQAVVYFPAGTYLVSGSIIQYYFTQFIGDVSHPKQYSAPNFTNAPETVS